MTHDYARVLGSCPNGTGVQIVSKLVDEWNAHDLDSVYAHLSDDYREYINGVLAKSGRGQAREADADLCDMIPDCRRTVEELWALPTLLAR